MIKLFQYQITQYLKQDTGDYSSSRTVIRKTIQDISREIPMYPNPIYRSPPKTTEISLQEVPRNLADLDMDFNTDFLISETYQRHDKPYFQEPQNSLINTGKLV